MAVKGYVYIELSSGVAGGEGGACAVPASRSQSQLSAAARPYAATLPRKAAGGE